MDLDALRSALAVLEARYGELRELHEQQIQELEVELSSAHEDRQRLRNELELLIQQRAPVTPMRSEEEFRRLHDQLAVLQNLHTSRCREVEVLRAECERRYPALLLSEDRGRALDALQRQLDQCMAERDAHARERERLQSLLNAAEGAPRQTDAAQASEQALQEAREEAELLRLQLHQVLEELELRSWPRQAPAPPSPVAPDEDAEPLALSSRDQVEAINRNRAALMAPA